MDKGKDKVLVLDLDGTLTLAKEKGINYSELKPNIKVVQKVRQLKDLGWYIIIYTSRNMNTYDSNVGLINANTASIVIDWLKEHKILYDEIYFGKPWCGFNGFYVDDKAIRPSEFISLSVDEISTLLDKEIIK